MTIFRSVPALTRCRGFCLATCAVALASLLAAPPAWRADANPVVGQSVAVDYSGLRRLNEAQYNRAIHQIFGNDIKVPGRFEPPLRDQGLLAIGASTVTVTPSGFEQYELRAREIAAQVISGGKAEVPCKLGAVSGFDEACATEFLNRYGRQLFRRPLMGSELAASLKLVKVASESKQGFAKGLEIGLSRLLVSPHFIFRIERSEPDPRSPGQRRLDDYSLASRISFLLWDAPPDEALLDGVAKGDFGDPGKLAAQVDRMLLSPKFEQGVRSFFSDMLGYEHFQGLAKDQALYPKFNSQLAKDAQEQTLRTIVDLLVTNRGDYRDLFTTQKTFINRSLGALYKVPVSSAGFDGWAPYTFPASEPRAGILSLAGFLMLDPTHEGRSSPTIRGKNVREQLLCQMVPQPPPNVDFALVQDVSNPLYRTARQRLTVHQENPACAGCHALTDPIGLAIENYDAVGNYRTHENSALIDASGNLDGQSFIGLLGLSQRLAKSPDVPSCIVQRTFEYGVGRSSTGADNAVLESAIAQFAKDRFRFPDLMRRMAISDALRTSGPVTEKSVAANPYFHRRMP